VVFDPLSLRGSGPNMAMFGLTAFVSAASPRRVVRKKNETKVCFNPPNAQDSEKLSPKTSGVVNGLSQRKFPDLRNKGSTLVITCCSPTQLRLVTPQLCESVIFGGVRAIGIVVECGRSAKLKRQDHIRPKQGPENIGKGNRGGGRHKKQPASLSSDKQYQNN